MKTAAISSFRDKKSKTSTYKLAKQQVKRDGRRSANVVNLVIS